MHLLSATALAASAVTIGWTSSADATQARVTFRQSLAGGYDHTCAITEDATVRCWGNNAQGQAGNGTTSTDVRTPVTVTGLTGVTQVSSSASHTCALLGDGTARCWGWNLYGQLGIPATTQFSSTPVAVVGLSGVTALSAGVNHTCALLGSGTVRCWGYNGWGQLGNGTFTSSSTPRVAKGILGATAIAAGAAHTCALLGDGTVRCWGYNDGVVLGNAGFTTLRSPTPIAVSRLTGVTAISAGHVSTCALISNGTVRCWGHNQSGALGNGTTTDPLAPVAVAGLAGVTSIASGTGHTCALLVGGSVRCWGANLYGELGVPPVENPVTGEPRPVSTAVAVPGIVGATAVMSGSSHTCASFANGSVRCWGENHLGQLGDGTVTSSVAAVAVAALPAVRQPTVAPTVPWAVGAPSATPGPSSVTLSWHAPANGGSPITDYKVQYSVNLGGTQWAPWVTYADGVTNSASATVAGLMNGTTYVFRIAARNGLGVGLFSPRSPAVTPRTVPSRPGAPTAVAGNHSVALRWSAPANGGSAITDYLIQYTLDLGTTWTSFHDGVRATTGATVTGLPNGKKVVFRVTAFNSAGRSPRSPQSNAVIPHAT